MQNLRLFLCVKENLGCVRKIYDYLDKMAWRFPSFRTFAFILFVCYLMMLFFFQHSLNIANTKEVMERIRTRPLFKRVDPTKKYQGNLEMLNFTKEIPQWLPWKYFRQLPCRGVIYNERRECKSTIPDSGFCQLGNNAYLYSAYLDLRFKLRFIRVMVIIPRLKRIPDLFCHFSQNGYYYRQPMTRYEMCENHGRTMGGFIMSCEVPEFIRDPVCKVSISRDYNFIEEHSTPLVTLPVRTLNTSSAVPKFQFGVCIPPLFGNISQHRIIEFIEFLRILGAQHFVFYAYVISKPIADVLKYYSKKALVTMVPWPIPPAISGDSEIWYHGQILAINDCLYRNMPRFEYLAFNDIDEFIIPRQHSNWPQLIRDLYDKDRSGYCFQSAFFDIPEEFDNETRQGVFLTQEYIKRTAIVSKLRTKCIVKPERIYEKGIHHISKPSAEKYTVKKVDKEVALLHHYRKCIANFGMKCREFVTDSNARHYGRLLETNTQKIMQDIFITKEDKKRL